MSERFLYLPSMFFCVALGLLATRIPRGKTAVFSAVAVIVTLSSGVCISRNTDWRTSRDLFQVTHEQAAGSHYVAGMLAMALAQEEAFEDAEKMFRSALSIYQQQTGTDQPQFAIGLALVFLKKNMPEAALVLVEPLEKVSLPIDQMGCVVGEGHRQMGDIDKAEAAFVRCLGTRPDSVSARVGLATVALQRNNPERALRFYKAILDQSGELPEIIASMGDVHREMGHLPEAMNAYQRAVDTRPDLDAAHVAIGSIHAERGDLEAAASSFQKAIEINSLHSEARVSLAILDAKRGRIREAEHQIKKVLERDPRNRTALFNLGVLYLRQGKVTRGRQILERLLETNPGDDRVKALLDKIVLKGDQ